MTITEDKDPVMDMDVTASSISQRRRSWYLVVLMSLCYGMGELSHFMVGTTTRLMAQDLQYGDQSCLRNDSVKADSANFTCSDYLNETTCNSLFVNEIDPYCQWNYNGQGIEYQILAGPSFILAFTIGGLLIGSLADRFNRVIIFGACTILFSLSTIIMGTSQDVWQLIVLRFGVAFGESACQPVSASLVMSLFPQAMHGAALGLVNWGIYFGYALSYVVGTYIPALNILGQGWRWSYFLSGMPGLVLAVVMMLTSGDPRESLRGSNQEMTENKSDESDTQSERAERAVWRKLKHFFSPTVLLLCLGACVRHTAGFSWAYNSQLYHDTYFPDYDVGLWLFFVSIVGGSIGILVGGAVSDRIVKRIGLQARAWVLAASQVVITLLIISLAAAPFGAGVLLLSPPYNFASLLAAYVFAETWFGVLFAILVELIPASECSFTIAVFLFIMNNVGGNLPVIVAPLSRLIGYRETLLLVYPGGYLLSSILFGLVGLSLRNSS